MGKAGRPTKLPFDKDGELYRECSKCHRELPISMFYKSNKYSCGYASWCRECSNKAPIVDRTNNCKECIRCHAIKPFSLFGTDNQYLDGMRRECLECSETRICNKCGNNKPIDEFVHSRAGRDGFMRICKKCFNKMQKEYHLKRYGIKVKGEKTCRDSSGNPIGRVCSKCNQYKPVEDFYIEKNNRLNSQCRKCANEARGGNEYNSALAKKMMDTRKLSRDGLKRCSSCNEIKPLSEFATHGATKNATCKACTNKWMKNYKSKHKSQYKEYRRKRTRIKNGTAGSHTDEEWNTMIMVCGNRCLICERSTTLTRDHIVPITKKGTDFISNIQPLCVSCNSSKSNTLIVDYRWKITKLLNNTFDMSLPMYSE